MDQAIYEVLTQEQKEKVQQLLKEEELRRNEEYRNEQKLIELKDQQDNISFAYFMGFISIISFTILCGLGIFFIPGKSDNFDTLMGVLISLTGFCGFITFSLTLNLLSH